MLTRDALTKHLARESTPSQAALLAEGIVTAYTDLAKTSDFNELVVAERSCRSRRDAV